jgi:threonyl-tRNA synthetase
MTLNDGHVFCPPERLADEIADILSMVEEAYRALGIPAPRLRLSRPDPGAKYAADPAIWQQSEAMIHRALERTGAA